MELYVLDGLFRRSEVVDKYESCVWTERFSEAGDFELNLDAQSPHISLLGTGQRLAMNKSDRIMTIESIEKKETEDGRSLYTFKGPSLEDITDDRPALSSLSTTDAWTISDKPAQIIRKLFTDICVTGIFDPGDVIPFITEGSLYEVDSISEPSTVTSIEISSGSLYQAIKTIADSYNMGFRLVRNGDKSQLFFHVYMGSDRTTKQTTRPAVIFSSDFGTLTDTSYIRNIADTKNVAYVIASNGYRIVYAIGSENVVGLDRRVMVVDANDIDLAAGTALQDALLIRGREELALQRSVAALDGEVSKNSSFTYGEDYNLGDVVELRDNDGNISDMQVTEQIFVDDGEGERAYPTLKQDLFITPGSWYSTTGAHVWDDMTQTWAEV